MPFSFLVPKHSLSLWGFHKSPSPELVSSYFRCAQCFWKPSCTERVCLTHGRNNIVDSCWMGKACASSSMPHPWSGRSSPEAHNSQCFSRLRKCWTWRTKPVMDMQSAVASKGQPAKEEQWCGREHVAALVLPKNSTVLIRFSELTKWISSVCCPP